MNFSVKDCSITHISKECVDYSCMEIRSGNSGFLNTKKKLKNVIIGNISF